MNLFEVLNNLEYIPEYLINRYSVDFSIRWIRFDTMMWKNCYVWVPGSTQDSFVILRLSIAFLD